MTLLTSGSKNLQDFEVQEDIGSLLYRVQEDIHQLKHFLFTPEKSTHSSIGINSSPEHLDISNLKHVLNRTENSIKQASEQYAHLLNSQVRTLPAIKSSLYENFNDSSDGITNKATTLDLQIDAEGHFTTKAAFRSADHPQNRKPSLMMVEAADAEFQSDLTPGQKSTAMFEAKILNNPQNKKIPELLQTKFNVKLPELKQINKKDKTNIHIPTGNIIKGSLVEPLGALPKQNRQDPLLPPPSITDRDANAGILSLTQRGLIPPASEISLKPDPVSHQHLNIYPGDRKFPKTYNLAVYDLTRNIANVKLDPSALASISPSNVQLAVQDLESELNMKTERAKLSGSKTSHRSKSDITVTDGKDLGSSEVTSKVNGRSHSSGSRGRNWEMSGTKKRAHRKRRNKKFTEPLIVPKMEKLPSYSTVAKSGTSSIQLKPPPATPASPVGSDSYFSGKETQIFKFAIQKGKLKDNQDFENFRQRHCINWTSIMRLIPALETWCSEYNIPVAFVNCDKFAALAQSYDLGDTPATEKMLDLLLNREQVEVLINTPGQRFKGKNGRELAALEIQRQFRGYVCRKKYLEYRHQKWNAGMIAIQWMMKVKMAKMRRYLKNNRTKHLDAFRKRNQQFVSNWAKLKQSRRVEIHIPSLGYNQHTRDFIPNMRDLQAKQIARICHVRDPLVDIIYISPVFVQDDQVQYYARLLKLNDTIEAGLADGEKKLVDNNKHDVVDGEIIDKKDEDLKRKNDLSENNGRLTDITNRYSILVPDHIESFPTHHMCLSSLLKYSARTMRRLKQLVKGRDAYIVPGVLHHDDLSIADTLKVPVLAPELEVQHLYSTKSGARRIFSNASVSTPPGDYDIYNMMQLHDSLASLITEHIYVSRWLFKLDDTQNGSGIAYFDTEHLPCYAWVVKESARYGDKWAKKWAQEPAYQRVLSELGEVLEKFAKPCNTKRYPTWQKFINDFLGRGGVVEAYAPSDSVTNITVDFLIEPDGTMSLECVGDQLHSISPLQCFGLSVPQMSIDPTILGSACERIKVACVKRKIIGYVCVDFATFIHPNTDQQVLWATDLTLRYSETMAMTSMLKFMTRMQIDPRRHVMKIPEPLAEHLSEYEMKRRERFNYQEKKDALERYAVISMNLSHTNLQMVHYSVFFEMCRAHGIGFDIKEKQGTLFSLIDSDNRKYLGKMCISDSLEGALSGFANNLNIIHQEISAPHMQGVSNFHEAIAEIENILGVTDKNASQGK